MAKQYRVWACIEVADDESEEEEQDLGEPTPIGTFDTVQEADAFVDRLSEYPEGAHATEHADAIEREREQGDGEATVAEMETERSTSH